DLAIICLIAGPLGARVFFVAQFWDRYFADRPARLTVGEIAPLTSEDALLVSEGSKGTLVPMKGDETTLEKLQARLDKGGVRAHLVTLVRRKTAGEVDRQVRGLVIESEA